MNTSSLNQYPVIDAAAAFDGAVHSTVSDCAAGLYVDYSGQLYNDNGPNLLFNEYKKLPDHAGKELRVITWAEYDRLEADYNQSKRTRPAEIDQDRFEWLLECLPPCRWHNAGGWEVFHVSERITGDLVTWCARNDTALYGPRFYEFIQPAGISDHALIELLKFAPIN